MELGQNSNNTSKYELFSHKESQIGYLDKLLTCLNTRLLNYKEILTLYNRDLIDGGNIWEQYFPKEDTFEYHYFHYSISHLLDWNKYYNVLNHGTNIDVWNPIIKDNFDIINGNKFYPEFLINKSNFLKIISKYDIDVISRYNCLKVTEVNTFIRSQLANPPNGNYWYFHHTERISQDRNKYPYYLTAFINPYCRKYDKVYSHQLEWKFIDISEKTNISINIPKSLFDKDFNLFSQLYLQDIYNKSILEYCSKNNIDISPKWKSEYELFLIIKNNYNTQVIHQYSPKWLGRLIFDVYIPEYNIAIEYQGIQHYKPISIFGGEIGFNDTKRRDRMKYKLCQKNGCLLIYHKFSDDVNDILIKIDEAISTLNNKKNLS